MSIHPLSSLIKDYIQNRAEARLEKLDKEAEDKRKSAKDSSELSALEVTLSELRQKEEDKYLPHNWLTDAVKRAEKISFVSHALKFTHTDAKGSSILVKPKPTAESYYLTTDLLQQLTLDVVCNAALLDVAGLLTLSAEGKSIADHIASKDSSPLEPFAQNPSQLEDWQAGFEKIFTDKTLATHNLSKQVYFPIGDSTYHLISPLFSSSLCDAIYHRVHEVRYSESMKAARKARRESKYSSTDVVSYSNLAVQSFGGTKPQNVSQLNSKRKRGGRAYLFSCSPPDWKQQLKLPIGNKNAFWKEYDRRVWRKAKSLQSYLIAVRDRNNIDIRTERKTRVDALIDQLFMVAAEIKNAIDKAGWSDDSEITQAEKLWLDPLNTDPDFQEERKRNDWQEQIASQFALWLNRKLKHDKLDLGDAEYKAWFKEVINQFKEDMRAFG